MYKITKNNYFDIFIVSKKYMAHSFLNESSSFVTYLCNLNQNVLKNSSNSSKDRKIGFVYYVFEGGKGKFFLVVCK
jgi:hypothetical protein